MWSNGISWTNFATFYRDGWPVNEGISNFLIVLSGMIAICTCNDVTPHFAHSGMFGLVVGHPMDTIKTNQQMTDVKVSNLKITVDILKREGVPGLFKGLAFPLLSAGTLNSVYFGVYGTSLRILQGQRDGSFFHFVPVTTNDYPDVFVAGSIGGFFQVLVACPSELVKVRMQIGQGIFKSTVKSRDQRPDSLLTIKDIYQKFGFRGFYVGLVPMLCRDVISSGVYILSYHHIRHNFYGEFDVNPGALETIVAGGTAGTLSWLPVVPFDTIKSRMQADDLKNPTYKGMVECGQRLLRDGGMHSFYKGFTMIALRSFPVNAAIFLGYETVSKILNRLLVPSGE